MLPLQQPVGHPDALHTHWPVVVSQACPALHAAQALPPAPHWPVVSSASGTHVDPLRQPEHAVLESGAPSPLKASVKAASVRPTS